MSAAVLDAVAAASRRGRKTRRRLRLLPRSLFGRLMLILVAGLVVAQLISFGLVFYERTQSSLGMMIRYVGKDVASSVAILEQQPAPARLQWLQRLDRRNYRYTLGAVAHGGELRSGVARRIAKTIIDALGSQYEVKATQSLSDSSRLLLHTRLHDGAPLTLEFSLQPVPLSPWMISALVLQLLLLAGCGWLAVRWVTRPLTRLAEAADTLAPDLTGPALEESGSTEVVRAAKAFNSMQRRIVAHLRERMQILAAISHDLQTPITRMRLRADLLDDAELRDKLHGDLNAMQLLVEDGIAYARDGQGITESACRLDLDALLDSLVHDYTSAGRQVQLRTAIESPFTTRPNALRRVVMNLIDNALKFGKAAEVEAESAFGGVRIRVLDRGPGIPPAEMQAVLQPFYRIEASRNRDTGGSGLGLAIAQQLTSALGGTLTLVNRAGGGLEARIFLPAAATARRRRTQAGHPHRGNGPERRQ